MKKVLQISACLALAVLVWTCESPEMPDFKLDQKLQVPLTVSKTYQFLGGSGALIDTTSGNFDSLFTIDNDGLVRLSKEEDFAFGDLNDAIPEVNVDPVTVISQVGEIGLSNFSSSGSVGTTSFADITGSGMLQKDDFLPGASTTTPINIDFNTDYFESATIKSNGYLVLTVTNNLGFDIDNLSITLNSGNSAIGSMNLSPFNHSTTETGTISIPAGTQLYDLNIDISVSWSDQNMKADAGNLIVNDVTGKNLVASQVKAAIESQEFSSSSTTHVDESKFVFSSPDHFIELSSGKISIAIVNQINLGIQKLKISFPAIRNRTTDIPLVLEMKDIPSSQAGGNFSTSFDLSGYRIYALANEVTYNIHALTENTQQGTGSDIRTINEQDELEATVKLNDLEISRASGIIKPKTILLNEDVLSNGASQLDAFNDAEAEIINIDGISDLSEQISNITFANPVLSTVYETNLTVDATVYAVIVGINSSGKAVYLSGKQDGNYFVSQSEIPSALTAHGIGLNENQLIKFELVPSVDGSTVLGVTEFNNSETNASEFFSNLPSEIRFVGVATINKDGDAETISTPVNFDPRLSVDLPINFSAENASFSDTLDADLKGLPGKGDEQSLSQTTLTVNYANGLPFGLDLSLIMIDENGEEVMSYPLTSQDPLKVQAASVDGATGFVEEGGTKKGKLQISFDEDQLKILNLTRSIILEIGFNTTQQQEVKVRAEDSLSLSLKMSANITSTVN